MFDLHLLETDDITSADIDDEILQNEIKKDLDDKFGSDAVSVVVSSNESLRSVEEQRTFFDDSTVSFYHFGVKR